MARPKKASNQWRDWLVANEFTHECKLDDDALVDFIFDIFKDSTLCGGDVEIDYTDISTEMLEFISAKIEGYNNPNKEEKEDVKMERANKLTVETTENGYVAHFYRTHKHIADIEIPTENGEHNNSLRESARTQAIEKCEQYNIIWNPEIQAQAWDRKYNTYMTDEEVAEDTLTLVTPAIERLVSKCKYDTELIGIEVATISPKKSNLTYIENGRYTKSGAWCCADIEILVKVHCIDTDMEIRYNAELKSGQICKPKTTILEWNLMTLNEMMLNGIEIPVEEEVA